MPSTEKKTAVLLEKANSLPLVPGVYIMKDRNDRVIYVGKSRKLKNRVSQYFQNSHKNTKTERMVRSAEDFEYIICSTEMEALTLENSLIKQYSPRYNIRLKDAKSYPYIKITTGEYPRIIYTRARLADRARYFGPFSGTSTVFSVLNIIYKSLGIPSCKLRFPEDIGKKRPCIYYQMHQCCGVCTGNVGKEEYDFLIKCAADILRGNTAAAKKLLDKQMFDYAEEEKFEAAARCRDTMRSLDKLSQKQHVVASPDAEYDVFGLWSDEFCTCISAIYVREGAVTDKNDFVFGADRIIDSGALVSFLAGHYSMNDYIPRTVLLSFELEAEDYTTISEYLSQIAGRKITVRTPERGDMKELCATVVGNAAEKGRQYKLDSQKDDSVLLTLAHMLGLEVLPERIEAYDISNIGTENITAGMVVCERGKLKSSDYRSFNIKSVQGTTDDYASMREALSRRLKHLKTDDRGSFSEYPDLILLDGGKGHVSVIKALMKEENVDIPVFGMVKDDYHKTRALCTDTEEINIAKERSVFMLIYKLQEEVHRFTVGRTENAKRRTVKHSSLESIAGIGPAKAKLLLSAFGGLGAVKNAGVEQLRAVRGISASDAENIVSYFAQKNKGITSDSGEEK